MSDRTEAALFWLKLALIAMAIGFFVSGIVESIRVYDAYIFIRDAGLIPEPAVRYERGLAAIILALFVFWVTGYFGRPEKTEKPQE